MILYFTGTGNSLYVAKQLDETTISIPQALKNNNLEFSDDTIGIVYPIYGHDAPRMVREFLKKTKFNTSYLYVILTYGNRHGGASEIAAELFKSLGHKVSYINTVLMVDNWLPAFDMVEQKAMDKKTDENIALIKTDIASKKEYFSIVTEVDREAHRGFIERFEKAGMSINFDSLPNFFKFNDKCTGCGICVRVCPADCISIVDGKATQNSKGCNTCLSCIHNCPANAIELSMPEKNSNARYRNENISLKEIIEANN